MIKRLLIVFILLLTTISFPFCGDVFATSKDTLTVYYFHTTYRCSSCTRLEEYVREAVYKHFPSELKSGKIKFASLNVDDSANQHYVQDYQLSFKSVIVSVRDGAGRERKWTNLNKVWGYLRNREALSNYVISEIRKNMQEVSGA